jgi:hypothetical protein
LLETSPHWENVIARLMQRSESVQAPMHTYLFDDRGDMWDAKSRRLAEVLQASIGGDELIDYVIRNLGFVSIAEGKDSVRIRLRPSVVSQVAFSALLYWLHDQPIQRVLLSLLDTEWSHELLRSREETVQRLMSCITFHAGDRIGDFLERKRSLQVLPSTSPLRAVVDIWSQCAGKFDRERFFPVLEKALNRQFVLVEANNDTPSLYFKDIGSGLPKLSEYCLPPNVNLRVEDQPDYAYGKWVSGLYRDVLTTGEPTLQEIDAVIRWPENPRKNYRYRRLVLPCKSEGNSTMLLGVTQLDPLINLRAKSN